MSDLRERIARAIFDNQHVSWEGEFGSGPEEGRIHSDTELAYENADVVLDALGLTQVGWRWRAKPDGGGWRPWQYGLDIPAPASLITIESEPIYVVKEQA